MHPKADEWFVLSGRHALRIFTFMVRENEIGATAMYINGFAQQVSRHRGAFNMPTGTARPPRAIPGWFTRRLRLPEDKIKRITFVRIVGVIAALVGKWQQLSPRQMT